MIGSRVLQPKILETKEELLTALKAGELRTSRYNTLNPNEKLFVELVVFGGYTGEQAIRCIEPKTKNALAIANRMASSPAVSQTLEELSIAKDKKFMAEISSVRDMALDKLKYIMCTTADQTLAASCAKIILDKSADMIKNVKDKDEPVGQISFKIQVENAYVNGATPSTEPVIIPIDVSQEDIIDKTKAEQIAKLESDIQIKKDKLKELSAKVDPPEVNPDTGLPYVISYEGVDNYNTDSLPTKAKDALVKSEWE